VAGCWQRDAHRRCRVLPPRCSSAQTPPVRPCRDGREPRRGCTPGSDAHRVAHHQAGACGSGAHRMGVREPRCAVGWGGAQPRCALPGGCAIRCAPLGWGVCCLMCNSSRHAPARAGAPPTPVWWRTGARQALCGGSVLRSWRRPPRPTRPGRLSSPCLPGRGHWMACEPGKPGATMRNARFTPIGDARGLDAGTAAAAAPRRVRGCSCRGGLCGSCRAHFRA
jgi:hypothetical protein